MADLESNEELRLETNIHILDHLAYTAIAHVFNLWYTCDSLWEDNILSENIKSHLHAVDSFANIFDALHGEAALTPLLRFRLRLFKFVCLFVLRHAWDHDPTLLEQVRLNNWIRAKKWGESTPNGHYAFFISLCQKLRRPSNPEISLPRDGVMRNGSRIAERPETPQTVNPQRARLLDLLPSFVNVIDARVDLYRTSAPNSYTAEALRLLDGLDGPRGRTRPPMDLIAEFALQACLEQCKLHLVSNMRPVAEAFSWGIHGMSNHTSSPTKSREEYSNTDASMTGLEAKNVFQDSSSYDPKQMFDAFPGNRSRHDGLPPFAWPIARRDYLAHLADIMRELQGKEQTSTRSVESLHKALSFEAFKVSARFSDQDFERDIVEFLWALHEGLDVPLLAAVEQGQPAVVDGVELDDEDIQHLRRIVDLGMGNG